MIAVDKDKELQTIEVMIDTLEGRVSDEAHAFAANFAVNELLVDESPLTWRLAAAYSKLALGRSDLIMTEDFNRPCVCDNGWLEKADRSVVPCARCRSESNEKWFQEHCGVE